MVILLVNFVLVMKALTIYSLDVFMLNRCGCGWGLVKTFTSSGPRLKMSSNLLILYPKLLDLHFSLLFVQLFGVFENIAMICVLIILEYTLLETLSYKSCLWFLIRQVRSKKKYRMQSRHGFPRSLMRFLCRWWI